MNFFYNLMAKIALLSVLEVIGGMRYIYLIIYPPLLRIYMQNEIH